MADKNNDKLEKYFRAARKEPLVASLEETKLLFEMNAPTVPSSFPNSLKMFFSQKINIIYSVIGVVLVSALVLIEINMNNQHEKPDSPEQEVTAPVSMDDGLDGVITEDDAAISKESEADSPPPTEVHKEFTKEDMEQKVKEEEKPTEEVERIMKSEKSTPDTLKMEITKPTEQEEKQPESKVKKAAVLQPIKVKPPFEYIFTPQTQESDLRKLQKDLAADNIKLEFSKLKYKDGNIEKIEGTIEMDGYHGTFTTDEFDDFTFKWSYSKYKGNAPEKFDIIINTPMKKKSNTAVHIDVIE